MCRIRVWGRRGSRGVEYIPLFSLFLKIYSCCCLIRGSWMAKDAYTYFLVFYIVCKVAGKRPP